MVLHYGQGVFEGLKAYRTASGGVQLFRPQDNFQRLNRSNRKLCIPESTRTFALEALKAAAHRRKGLGAQCAGNLALHPADHHRHRPLSGCPGLAHLPLLHHSLPVGAYYPEGFNPVKIWVTQEHVRAVRGGVGDSQDPRQLRRQPACRRQRPTRPATPRCCGWTVSSRSTSKRSAP